MLPKDTKLAKDVRNAINADRLQQKTLDDDLQLLPEQQRIKVYSDRAFREAAIEWLVATDQVYMNSSKDSLLRCS